MAPGETTLLRVVPDPNILVSAFLSEKGIPAAIVLAWEAGAFELIVSPRLLHELRAVLLRPKFRRYGTEADVEAYLVRLASATARDDPPARRIVPDDEKDDYLMALGQGADAHYVVSGDPHLTGLHNPQPVVLTPRGFYELLVEQGLAIRRP